ncbi:hemagglutinin [Lake Chad virus]|uniref:Hemagglutinin n=1 Tax=Lake Chad virus TaxID=688438 RepID=A0A7T8EH05_9ORTO|nr:hemagglutinin [Lake Chad virus]QQO86216.1 hemagglutinin [Lake Chad virus]
MIVLCLLMLIQGAQPSPCSSESCSGPYRIAHYKMPTINVSNHKTHAHVWKVIKEVDGVMGYRSRYTAYCYEGGVLDSNTGCYKAHSMYPPSAEELQKWAIDKKCQYGVECPKGGDCWGNGADACHDESTNKNSAESKEYNGNNEEWMSFPYHTCISTWRCGVSKSKYPIHFSNVKRTRGGDSPEVFYSLATYDQHGNEIILDKHLYKIDAETNLYFEYGNTEMDTFLTELNCFFGNDQTPVCQLNDKFDEDEGQFVTFGEGLTASFSNFLISLDDEVKISGKSGGKKYANKAWIQSKLGKAASLQDIKEVIDVQMWSHQEAGYNMVQLYQLVGELTNTLTEVINSVGKLDDELIGKLVGVEGRSKWFNKELFHMCPCFQIGDFGDSNCASGYIFADGRIKTDPDGSKCTSYGGAVTPIYLFDNISYQFAVLHTPPAHGVAQDWEGWSWLASEKEKLVETMIFQDSVAGGKNVLSQLYKETVDSFNIWRYFERFSALAAWLALIISILGCLRR